MSRRALTFGDRSQIDTGLKAGWSITKIAEYLGRDKSIVSREITRNRWKTAGYQCVHAHVEARRKRRRPKQFKIDTDPVLKTRVIADLGHSRTPRQVAGRLRQEAQQATVVTMNGSPHAHGNTVSHEAIYRWIYALPKGELARHGIMLRSKRKKRKPTRVKLSRRPLVGMVSIDDRPDIADRRIPGHWEGDLVIGAGGRSAIITLVERTTRFLIIRGLPLGKNSQGVCDALIDVIDPLPYPLRQSLTWDQGTEMARHAALTLATTMPVFFAHPRSPWERGSNENTNGLIREYLPKGTHITSHQPYLDAIADEINDRPRAALDFFTPIEKFTELLNNNVA